jgi:hypothetical protein
VGVSQPPTSTSTSTSTPTASATATSPLSGAAEAQAVAPPGADGRESAANTVARATTQIDRLRRMQRAPLHKNRDSLDATLDDLESARRNVLQVLREVELEPGGSVVRGQLRRHLAELRSALDASYEGWPPTGQAERRAAPR